MNNKELEQYLAQIKKLLVAIDVGNQSPVGDNIQILLGDGSTQLICSKKGEEKRWHVLLHYTQYDIKEMPDEHLIIEVDLGYHYAKDHELFYFILELWNQDIKIKQHKKRGMPLLGSEELLDMILSPNFLIQKERK